LIQFSVIGDVVRKRLTASLNRAVKETLSVKGENGEFGWLREANALNLHG
jgi:hypothetical protein